MFTVIIAEKEHLEAIARFSAFLKPFVNEENVAYCPWNRLEKRLDLMVPTLEHEVAYRDEWRAIVVNGNEGLAQQNPFDLVQLAKTVRSGNESRDEYLDRLQEAKFCAYQEAAEKPLTRLMTYLCRGPILPANAGCIQSHDFALYQQAQRKKAELRAQIIGDQTMHFAMPTEVLCVALRTWEKTDREITSSWMEHDEENYSNFYDRNLYFDRMRYLLYDIVPQTQVDYLADYLKFLCVLLITANHDTPSGALRPQRVYSLQCDNDDQALQRLLAQYDQKLENTSRVIKEAIDDLKRKPPQIISDQEVAEQFFTNANVQVSMPRDVSVKELYCKTKPYGLSYDCPEREDIVWGNAYAGSSKALKNFLKQPRRCLRKATIDMPRKGAFDVHAVDVLNEFQLEDLRDYTLQNEMDMIRIQTMNLYELDTLRKPLKQAEQKVSRKIENRLPRAMALGSALCVLAVFLISFVPMLVLNREISQFMAITGAFACGAVIILAMIGLICLFVLRSSLLMLIRNYNAVMNRLVAQVHSSMGQFSNYLSHLCNMMRGHSALNYRNENVRPDVIEERTLQKHLLDIRQARTDMEGVFGMLRKGSRVNLGKVEPYEYDFTRKADYEYPLPFNKTMARNIAFMQPGYEVEIPLDFIRSILLRREELYD